jgi:hypothetical protein
MSLSAVKIHIHAEPTEHIQTMIKRIIEAEVARDRRDELHIIACKLRDDCLKHVRAQAGEDDIVDPLQTALKALAL